MGAATKTRDELCRMTMREIRAHAREIGCCLGYSGSRKDDAISAVLSHQEHLGMIAATRCAEGVGLDGR